MSALAGSSRCSREWQGTRLQKRILGLARVRECRLMGSSPSTNCGGRLRSAPEDANDDSGRKRVVGPGILRPVELGKDRLRSPNPSGIANHQPEREPEIGREAFRKAIEGVMRAVPDSNWTTLRLFSEADFVLCHNRWSGTWNGTVFRGVPTPPGKRFSVEHMHVYRVENRQLLEHWVVRDDLAMMSQVGGLPG